LYVALIIILLLLFGGGGVADGLSNGRINAFAMSAPNCRWQDFWKRNGTQNTTRMIGGNDNGI
jgi:hypothetical protein